jgi:oligosaccharide repeat unit polymerase
MPWTLVYILDFIAILTFAVSYYRNCYRRGYRIDMWHFILLSACIIPNMLMLPFARNELNGVVLGQDYAAVMAVLPTVFLITFVGYYSMLVGGGLWRLRTGIGIRRAVIPLLDIPPRCSRMLMSSRTLLVFQSAVCLCLQVSVLLVYFAHNGFGFDLRRYASENPSLRPVLLLASNYSVVIASHCLARYVDKKEKVLLGCTLLLSLGLVFFGARSSILNIYLTVFLCFLIRLRSKVNLFKLFGVAVVMVMVILYLGGVRSGQYSLTEFFKSLVFLLLFGNTFSDLRDFSWVYAKWDHVFWAGKTYLAAFMAFVPRFASSFRDTWGLGVMTATTVGFDPEVHPGLRPGIFGEGFFNFGMLGVIAVGLLLGIAGRRVDIDVKRTLSSRQPSMMRAYASTALSTVVGSFALTAGFSGLYILVGIYFFSWICLQIGSLVGVREIVIKRGRGFISTPSS